MKKNIIASLLTFLLLAGVCTSCDYQEHADADYPETTVYQAMALEPVWNINKADEENVSMTTPGAPRRYILDKANNKFIVPMGLVQSGISMKSFTVDVFVDNSLVNTLIAQGGTLPVGTLPLPESAYTLPASVKMESNKQSASFNLEIQLSALTGANLGKKFAIAVKIDTSGAKVSEDLKTALICIDTTFLGDLL